MYIHALLKLAYAKMPLEALLQFSLVIKFFITKVKNWQHGNNWQHSNNEHFGCDCTIEIVPYMVLLFCSGLY